MLLLPLLAASFAATNVRASDDVRSANPALTLKADQVAIDRARDVYSAVNHSLLEMTFWIFDAQRPDAEYRSHVNAWSDDGEVRKIQVTDADDDGDVVTEYYYISGELVLADRAIKGYLDTGQPVTRIAYRQYFRNGAMTAFHSGVDGPVESPGSAGFAEAASERLAASAFYLAQAEWLLKVTSGLDAQSASGTVTSQEMGDAACRLALKDDTGEMHEELADFDLCVEYPDLVGKHIAYTRTPAGVMADSCEGDPDCAASRSVALVSSVHIMDDGDGAHTSFCMPAETVVFACSVGTRLISVCAAADDTGNSLQFRFGKPGVVPEFVWPETWQPPRQSASGGMLTFAGGGRAWLRLHEDNLAYVVYTGVGNWGPHEGMRTREGMVVERDDARISAFACTGPASSLLGPVWFDANGVGSRGEGFELPD